MKTLRLAVLAVLAAVLSFSCLADAVENNSVEKQIVYFIPHVRARRSPTFTLSGSGSNKSGYIKESWSGNVWHNNKNSIDARESVQHNWAKGFPSQNTYSVGGTVTHNLYKGPHTSLDVKADFDKTGNGRYSRNSVNYGLNYSGKF